MEKNKVLVIDIKNLINRTIELQLKKDGYKSSAPNRNRGIIKPLILPIALILVHQLFN